MDDPRKKIADHISVENGNIRPYDGIIFLCGGSVDATRPRPVSIRDALYRGIVKDASLERRTRLAEDYKDWSFDGHYKNLSDFEDHLAQLSSVIVLALESSGSLAELGLFTALQNFQKKLIVYISDHHYDQDSFVRLGPVKFLEDTLSNQAECFPWIRVKFGREEIDLEEIERIQPELIESLKNRIPENSSEEKFDRRIWLHRALLICELIWLMGALTLNEIKELCKDLGVVINIQELKQILFMLEKIEFISKVARSSQRFYLAKHDRSFINWGRRSIFDARRFQSDVVTYYERQDRRRFKVLQRERGRLDEEF